MVDKLAKGIRVFKRIHLALVVGGTTFVFFVVGVVLIKAFVEVPDFMFSIKDQMLADPKFQDVIGMSNGYSIWFDKDKAEGIDTIPFCISIDGEKDSSSVKIIGKYYRDSGGHLIYYKEDTLYKRL